MSLTRRRFVTTGAALAAASTLPRIAFTAAAAPIDVIVIGAGLSGLDAALILEENGLKVLMLEGRANHIGGRVYTLFDVPGHPEAGGNTIAGAYGRMIAAGQKYGVPTINLAPRFMKYAGQELYVGGEHIPLGAWPTHAANPFTGDMKKLPPWAWGGAMFKAHMPFKDLGAWADPANAAHDISMHQFLAANGASDAAINLGYNTNISYGTTSHDVSLLQQASADHWQQVNRVAPAPDGPPGVPFIGAYKGGNQKLPIAMAARLKGDRLMDKRVVSISTTDDGATVQCEDGHRYSAKAVVCSLPYSVLRTVPLDPLPPPVQLAAIQTLGYIPITQFHLVPKRAFWQDDGLAPSMWSDGISGSILAQRFGSTDDEVTSLTVWARGLNAQYVDRLGSEGGARAVVAEIERLRPAAKGQLEVAAVHSWALDPFSAGDWAIFQPGQVTRFIATMSQPHKRLFFCGEHTAVASRGMEGAMESAERVALEVLTAVG